MRSRSLANGGLVAVALVGGVFGLTGCQQGVKPAVGTSSSSAAASTAPATLSAQAAKTAACAAYNKTVRKAQVANAAFVHALDDPKRPEQQWNKPMSDAADNAVVILNYVAKDVEANVIKPQLDSELAADFKQFVQLARARADIFIKHHGTEDLNANAQQYDDVSNRLIETCK